MIYTMKLFKKIIFSGAVLGILVSGNLAQAEEKINIQKIEEAIINLETTFKQSLLRTNILKDGLNAQQRELASIISLLKRVLPVIVTAESKEEKSEIKISINEVKEKKINPNITAKTLSSSDALKNDTASFKFLAPIKPFGDAVYIPVVGFDAINLDIIDASTNDEIVASPTISVVSLADRVTGNDGNEYFHVSNPKTFAISVTLMPGVGDYYAELNGIRFTNVDVTDPGFTSFSGINIPFGDSWRSSTLTILN